MFLAGIFLNDLSMGYRTEVKFSKRMVPRVGVHMNFQENVLSKWDLGSYSNLCILKHFKLFLALLQVSNVSI